MAMKINDTENEDDINEGNRDDNGDNTITLYSGFHNRRPLKPSVGHQMHWSGARSLCFI